MKNRVFLIVLATLLLIATGVVAYGCQPTSVEKPIPPDPFTTTWYLGEGQRTVTFSGDSAGHIAGQHSDFELRLDNNSPDERWQDEYCIFLTDDSSIILEIAHAPFDISPSGSFHTSVPVTFPGELDGPYGMSVLIPDRVAMVTTIWIGEETPVSAGPWPDIRTCPAYLTEEWSRDLAEEFVRNSPTFAFDGIAESLELTATAVFTKKIISANAPAEDEIRGWEFTFRFESRHAGYGDRTGQMLSQVITPHEAVITVEQGKVISAIMDGKWDILRQSMLD